MLSSSIFVSPLLWEKKKIYLGKNIIWREQDTPTFNQTLLPASD